MAHYSKIHRSIANDSKFSGLSDEAKLVFFTALTHPHLTALGTLRVSCAGLASEMGWEAEKGKQALGELQEAHMLEGQAHCLWFPNFLKHNPPESPNVIKSWEKALEYLPECALTEKIVRHTQDFARSLPPAFQEALPKAFCLLEGGGSFSNSLREASSKNPNILSEGGESFSPCLPEASFPNTDSLREEDRAHTDMHPLQDETSTKKVPSDSRPSLHAQETESCRASESKVPEASSSFLRTLPEGDSPFSNSLREGGSSFSNSLREASSKNPNTLREGGGLFSNALPESITYNNNSNKNSSSNNSNNNKGVLNNIVEPGDARQPAALVAARPGGGSSTDLLFIFNVWKQTLGHPQAKLDDKRKTVIGKALKSGYSVHQLCQAIMGCSLTPHNLGKNDRGQRYDGLHVILRDADQIDRFIRNAQNPPQLRNTAHSLTESNIAACQNWLQRKQAKEARHG